VHFHPSLTLSDHAKDVLWYLAPSLVLAVAIRSLSGRVWLFSLLTLAGTFCHELAHCVIGLLTNARPVKVSLIPRRVGRNTYQMGSAAFANVRWYNAAPTALAPILVLALPYFAAVWRLKSHEQFGPVDAGLMFLLAPQFLSFWPSSTDWKLALRSWPYLAIAVSLYVFGRFAHL
jgi:hypothetical protein